MHWIWLLISIFCFINNHVNAQTDPRSIEKKILEDLLDPSKYDPDFRPYGTNSSLPWGGPVKVKVQLFLRSITKIDDNNEKYDVQLTFRQRWYDNRLVYANHSYATKVNHIRLSKVNRIWIPDLFFANELDSEMHDVLVPNELVRIQPNGHVLFSTRISLELSCPMEFRSFPFDGQRCDIKIPSYGYVSNELRLHWEKTSPIQISKSIHSDKFTLEKFSTGYCDTTTSTGEYSCLSAGFLFKRIYGYYQIQVFIPTSMLVLVSWLSFWIDRENVVGRLLLTLMTLLTMATQLAIFNNTVPVVSYTKAIDLWTGTCLTFSFGALVEFVIVHFLSKRQKQRKSSTKNEDSANIPLNSMGDDEKLTNEKDPPTNSQRNRVCCNIWPLISTPDGLDLVSRLIYPLIFILFNIIYWTANAFAFSSIAKEFEEEIVHHLSHAHHHHTTNP